MTGEADDEMKVNERVGKQLAELMGRRFAPSLRDVANTLADRKFTELISTVGGGRIGRQLDQLAARIAEEKLQALVEGRAGPAETLEYPSLEEFCVDFLFPLYAINPHSTAVKWCPSWAEHIAATVRLEALWRSFEHHRLEGLPGVANWLVSLADPIMAKLMDPDGPFVFCDAIKGHQYNGEDMTVDLPHTPLSESSPYSRYHTPQPGPVTGTSTNQN